MQSGDFRVEADRSWLKTVASSVTINGGASNVGAFTESSARNGLEI